MSFGLGQLAGLGPDDLTQLMQRIQAYGAMQQDPNASGPVSGTQGQPPAIAGTEAEVQRLERQQASPQDAAALGGSPVDRLLFDRSGMGGSPNGFTGTADPLGPRNVPLPPARPSDDALSAQPTTTGTVSGMNPDASAGPQRRVVASSSYHPDLASSNPTGGRPAAAADYRGGPGDFDPLTGRLLGGAQPVGLPQVGPSAGVPVAQGAGASSGPQQSMMEQYARGVSAGNPDIGNLLFHLGIGIASNRGIGPGVAAGLQSYGASQSGSLKGQLEQIKFMQEQQGQQDTYNHLTQNLKLDPTAARAAMRNPTLLSNVLAQSKPNLQTIGGQIYDLNKNGGVPGQGNLVGPANGPPAGYRLAADGQSLEFIPGGDADPAVKERNAKAVATDKEQTPLLNIDARRKVGIPDNDTRAAWADPNGKVTFNDGPPPLAGKPGTTFYDRGTQKPILTVPSAKPDGFDTETKLRGEFSKQLGTFADVHDGYGRLIAATKQRQENPGSVSPASDISLVFGYMKMLDPGSVVREGEYATAKNAAGVPERVLNAYNKALTGEFLSDAQRRDFLGQASELYGTARKTAEGVAERYRNLATSYGADPSRAVYLPEMPTPPKLGQQSQAPAGGAAARYQDLMRSGMSKADAFAQMHKEGM